jgi:hypothetical protein
MSLYTILNLLAFGGLLFIVHMAGRTQSTLSRRVFTGLVLGLAFGFVLQMLYGSGTPVMTETLNWTNLVGDSYVRLLRMIIMPLILVTMIGAVLKMEAIASLGKIGVSVIGMLVLIGTGMNMALACDVRIAGSRARFDTRFLQIGIHPGGGHTWMLRRIAGPQATSATVLFGEVLDAGEALRCGLVWKVVEADALLTEATRFAARAAGAPRDLLIETKRTIADMAGVATHDDAVDRELVPQVWSTRQPWFAERIAALKARISGR